MDSILDFRLALHVPLLKANIISTNGPELGSVSGR